MKPIFFGVAAYLCLSLSFHDDLTISDYSNWEIESAKEQANSKKNNEVIDFLNRRIQKLNPNNVADKIEALNAMRDHIVKNIKENPSTIIKTGAEKAVGGQENTKTVKDYVDKIHSEIVKKIWKIDLAAVGTGKTTGHIANLTITNNSLSQASLQSEMVYIKSRNGFQSYVSHIPNNVIIPPKSTITIPLPGYCADPHVPPVPKGEQFPHPSEWLVIDETPKHGFTIDGNPPIIPDIMNPPGSGKKPPKPIPLFISDLPTLPSFNPNMINTIVKQPGFTVGNDSDSGINVTWPGTDDKIGGTFDPNVNAGAFAQVVTNALIRITETVDSMQYGGKYLTPFSNDKVKEEEAIIQQTFWVYIAGATGKNYEEEDFANNVYKQFEETTGTNITALPAEQKDQIDGGVNAFWNSFTATGVNAKIMSVDDKDKTPKPPPEKGKTNVPPPEKGSPCSLTIEEDPATYNLDFKYADTGNAESNKEAKEEFEKSLEQTVSNMNKAKDTLINITTPARSATAWSLWLTHAIGGFADGIAFAVDLQNPHKSAWSTEPLQTNSDGNHKVVLTHNLGPGCTSTLIGINLAKVRVKSKMLFTCGDIQYLKVLNFLGEIAIDIAIKKGKGTFKKLGKYLKEKTKDLAKGEVKDKIKEELQKISKDMEGMSSEEAEQAMEELLKDIEEGNQEEEEDDFLESLLAEMLVEGEEFKPEEFLEGQILDKVDSPIDWAPIKTNTYAMVRGSLEIKVDNVKGEVSSASGVRYNRKELEDEAEAVKGGGISCDEKVVSKISHGSITLETKGQTSSFSGAGGSGIVDTGHGHAVAKLESFNGYFVLAICDCPDQTYLDKYIHSMGTVNEGSLTAHMNKIGAQMNKIKFENSMEKALKSLNEKGDLPAEKADRAEEYKKWQSNLENAALDASKDILPCPK